MTDMQLHIASFLDFELQFTHRSSQNHVWIRRNNYRNEWLPSFIIQGKWSFFSFMNLSANSTKPFPRQFPIPTSLSRHFVRSILVLLFISRTKSIIGQAVFTFNRHMVRAKSRPSKIQTEISDQNCQIIHLHKAQSFLTHSTTEKSHFCQTVGIQFD